MTSFPPTVSRQIALKFCAIANWTYEAWITRRTYVDDNPSVSDTLDKAHDFNWRISTMMHEYVALQIAKLHDPPTMAGNWNISIEYIVEFGNWEHEHVEIDQMAQQLRSLYERIRPARMKILAHNDGPAHMAEVQLGAFEPGLDVEYFLTLQKFVDKVHARWVGGRYLFNRLAIADAELMLQVLRKSE